MKILMVCLGNICRSPVAEGVMRMKIEQYGIDAEVDSAGTVGYHVGERPDGRSTDNAKKNGVDISSQRSRQFIAEDLTNFDLIFAMDHSNYENVLALATTKDEERKVHLLLNVSHPGSNAPVPDPYYGGPNGFEDVFHLISNSCDIIAQKIANNETITT